MNLPMVEGIDLEHVSSNRATWDHWAEEYVKPGRRAWEERDQRWGIWGVPESDVGLLRSFTGGDVIELGCGTAYVSSWLADLGGRPVGIDNSSAQLSTARHLQREMDLKFPLIQCDAEKLPFNNESFDFAISEYGASIWCDPYHWIPEAARILKPGGSLAFLGNSALLMLCVADDDETPANSELRRSQFGMHRFEWPGDPGIEFHISHGDRIRLFRECGLEVEDLIEIQPSSELETRYSFVDLEWARKWPSEEAWIVRKK
ncbi:MAG: class I SAM-dependent methyltransferase [Acidimicrobiales bacterium]|nr:class I SAM-dependent methyltransferase [Acidimicrobiales bacterium]